MNAFSRLEDMGPDGPAALSRRIRTEVVDVDPRQRCITARRLLVECRLDWLYRKDNPTIDKRQWLAGMRFRGLWLASTHRTRVSASYSLVGACGGVLMPETVRQLEARYEVDRALEVLSSAQKRVVIRVCGEDEPMGLSKKPLKLGLDNLYAHFFKKSC